MERRSAVLTDSVNDWVPINIRSLYYTIYFLGRKMVYGILINKNNQDCGYNFGLKIAAQTPIIVNRC